MSDLSVWDVERRSGVEKRPDETVGEYLTRVGEEAGIPPETVSAVVDHVNRDQFAPAAAKRDSPEPRVEEYLRGVASVGTTEGNIEAASGVGDEGTDEGATARAEAGGIEDETAVASEEEVVRPLGRPPEDDGGSGFPKLLVLLIVLLLIGGIVAGGAVLVNGDLLGSSEEEPADDGTPAANDADEPDADDDAPVADDDDEETDDREPIDIGSDDEGDDANEVAGSLSVAEPLTGGSAK